LCSNGDIFGGKVPARTWFNAMVPLHEGLPVMPLPPTDPRYVSGAGPNVPNVVGQGENVAQLTLERAGFRVKRVVSSSDQPAGTVASEAPTTAQPGDVITLSVSDGTGRPKPAPRSPPAAAPYQPPQRAGQDQVGQPGQATDGQQGPDGQAGPATDPNTDPNANADPNADPTTRPNRHRGRRHGG
ncbi:MAG: PASTA domain-containing protein, partial [Pseudonocardiaceae bacterium]